MPATRIRGEQINIVNDFDLQSHKLLNVATPISGTDAANKAYIDNAVLGFKSFKIACRAVATTNLTLSGTQTVDGVALVAGDRVLCTGQTTASANGIYVVAAGAWARASDANTSGTNTETDLAEGTALNVVEGTANADSAWLLITQNPITLGTTNLTFQKQPAGITYTGSGPVVVTGSVISLGVASANIVLGNGSNVGVATPVTGDVTITNAGVTAVNNTSGSGFMKYTNVVNQEVPTGSINGANTTFTLAHTPVAGSESVYLNGELQRSGSGNNYTISGATITYLTAPFTNDWLVVNYVY